MVASSYSEISYVEMPLLPCLHSEIRCMKSQDDEMKCSIQ